MIHFSETVGVEIRLAVLGVNGAERRLGSRETPLEWGLGKDNEKTDEGRQLQGKVALRKVHFIF